MGVYQTAGQEVIQRSDRHEREEGVSVYSVDLAVEYANILKVTFTVVFLYGAKQ